MESIMVFTSDRSARGVLNSRTSLSHLQEEPLVAAAVDLLRCLNQLFGGVQCLTTGQQLSVQSLQFTLLLLLQADGPLIVSLRQSLQHIVVVLLQVLLPTAKVLLHRYRCPSQLSPVRNLGDNLSPMEREWNQKHFLCPEHIIIVFMSIFCPCGRRRVSLTGLKAKGLIGADRKPLEGGDILGRSASSSSSSPSSG
ncbi:hypothetical protein INR49_007181 [Caranx melampygus]|nr:hypothetical protein INR49_007181 [Caranx melampygus]